MLTKQHARFSPKTLAVIWTRLSRRFRSMLTNIFLYLLRDSNSYFSATGFSMSMNLYMEGQNNIVPAKITMSKKALPLVLTYVESFPEFPPDPDLPDILVK